MTNEACRYALANKGNLPEANVVIATLLHDLGTSHSSAARNIRGHGRRSVAILGMVCHFHLTHEEFEAIKLHMHGHAPQMSTNPLARLVKRADHMSAGNHVDLDRGGVEHPIWVITEEMKKTLPILTEEEFKRIRCPKEDLLEEAVNDFKGADDIDARYD